MAAGNERSVVVTRTFDAPRRLVFETWTKPEHLRHWFGPRGITLSKCEMDFRPGGRFQMAFRSDDGEDFPFSGVYREVVPDERIVWTATFPDTPGVEIVTEVTFAEVRGITRLTVKQTFPASFVDDPRARGAQEGWSETMDRLAEHVARRSR